MNTTKLWMAVLGVCCALTASAQRKQCMDADWRFCLGDGSAAIADPSVADSWRSLDLPHDWSVETEAAAQAGGRVIGPFSTNSIGKYQTGHTVGGEGWYMRKLKIENGRLKMDNGQFSIYFEGAYNQSWLYVNGTLCHENVYGYTSFRADVTELLHEGENTILVRVLNEGNNTRWYAGSGIYRHVWLITTPSLHADDWETVVKVDNGLADGEISVETRVYNEGSEAADAIVSVDIIDAQGTTVATQQTTVAVPAKNSPLGSAASRSEELSTFNFQLPSLHPWSPDTPYLYTARISVKDADGQTLDTFTKRFGVRTLSFSATEGFLLNGVPTLLRGGCVHHDNGLLGAAAFDKAERRKLELLKAQGFNAVRCSHNLPSENFLDVCDELGLMVIDECFDQWLRKKNNDDYHRYFADHSTEDIATMVRRDRNHPSIIMWSIGNEIPGRIEPAGMEVAARLRATVRELDTTRPITAAICGWDEGAAWNSAAQNWDEQDAKAFQSLDVGGYNYLYDKYEHDHQTHPDRVMCGLESYPKQASENWTLVEQKPYVIGDFVWTAMDYLGEAGIGAAYADHAPTMFQDWPWFNGYCGDLDLIGQKKPQSYYRDVVWRQAPITMAVQPTASQNNAWGWQLEEQHWTWPGREGQNVSVNVYSRAPRVRLYLNDTPLGDKAPGTTFWAGFTVPYQPGTLRAVNLDADGTERVGEEFVLRTTGPAVGVRCVYEDPALSAALNDLAYVTLELVDAEGNVVTSDCTTQISIRNIGAGELIACGTASPNDMKSFRSTTPTVFRGRALAILRSNGVAGEVKLQADIVEQEQPFTSHFFRNADFGAESLDGWTVSSTQYIKYNATSWHGTELDGFLESYTGWGSATTLAGQSISQSTRVLPAGQYTFAFDYNATFRQGSQRYQTEGTLAGVTVSAGGEQIALEHISGDHAQHATITFTLAEPAAVSFLVAFAADTNADWFALDNLTVEYAGDYDFDTRYIDKTASVPAFDGAAWPRMEGNASGGYTEAKLGSALYNSTGLAYWSPTPPTNSDFFRQDITGLPEGRYGIAAFCAANRWSSSDNDRSHQAGAFFFARGGSGTIAETEVSAATYALHSLVIDLKAGETLTLGMRAGAANGNNWCYLADITLVQLSAPNPDADGIHDIGQWTARPKDASTLRRMDNEAGAWYDLSGRAIAAPRPYGGPYIKAGGSQASKFIVK